MHKKRSMIVSIITTTYNSANTLADTINSVLRQTYHDIDYWIIDGNSTDDTLKIIQSYESRFDNRLHWISEPDRGIYDAMNKGLAHCKGDVIGILNSDDFFSQDTVIEEMVRSFEPDVDAIYGDVHFVYPDNLSKCVRYYSGSFFRPSLVQYGFIAPHPSFYIRKNIYEKYGYFKTDYKISADFELITRFCYNNHIRTKYLHLDFITMRIGGVSTRNLKARLLGMNETIKACRDLGIKTNKFKLSCKYIIKIVSALFIRK